MEGGEEGVNSRAKNAFSSDCEPTDMSDESELENVEGLGESEAEYTSEVEVISSTESGLTELGATWRWGCHWIKTLTGWIALDDGRG